MISIPRYSEGGERINAQDAVPGAAVHRVSERVAQERPIYID
jgi:hypothetical protein